MVARQPLYARPLPVAQPLARADFARLVQMGAAPLRAQRLDALVSQLERAHCAAYHPPGPHTHGQAGHR